jgi:hypothetical protein
MATIVWLFNVHLSIQSFYRCDSRPFRGALNITLYVIKLCHWFAAGFLIVHLYHQPIHLNALCYRNIVEIGIKHPFPEPTLFSFI